MSDLNIPESAVADYHKMQDALSQDAYEPTDLEVFHWAFANKTIDERDTCLAEDANFLLSACSTYAGVFSADASDDIRFRVAGHAVFQNMVYAFRRSWEDEVVAFFDNGGEL